MKMSKISTVVSSALLALAVSGSVFAAENAEGVKEHLGLTLERVKAAQAAAAAGNRDECLSNIKAAKQHYKEVTGDAAGKPLQDAIKNLKVGQEECLAGDTAKGATTLTGVVNELNGIVATSKK
ncbi:MAG: hypothetical protein LUO80_02250 [Methylococcaceae bacterium]|jgi:hypothetical protein|nr:hypothetical protein [Methylococcaceae bacterium]